jgi:hypothetical protein
VRLAKQIDSSKETAEKSGGVVIEALRNSEEEYQLTRAGDLFRSLGTIMMAPAGLLVVKRNVKLTKILN